MTQSISMGENIFIFFISEYHGEQRKHTIECLVSAYFSWIFNFKIQRRCTSATNESLEIKGRITRKRVWEESDHILSWYWMKKNKSCCRIAAWSWIVLPVYVLGLWPSLTTIFKSSTHNNCIGWVDLVKSRKRCCVWSEEIKFE